MGTGSSKKRTRQPSLTIKPIDSSKQEVTPESKLPPPPPRKQRVSTHSNRTRHSAHSKSYSYRSSAHPSHRGGSHRKHGKTRSIHSKDSRGSQKSKEHKIQAMERQVEEFGYKKPAPPSCRKCDAFDVNRYVAVDTYASKDVPKKILYGHYEQVVDYFTTPLPIEMEKMRALFVWTVVTDVADQQFSLEMLPDIDTPLEYLLQILWKIGNHAHLFTKLCRMANIPCVTIYGMTKSAAYQLGEKMVRPGMCSQWNAVYIAGNWRLIDLLWASTCVKHKKAQVGNWAMVADDDSGIMEQRPVVEDQVFSFDTKHTVNEFFFLTDPDQLIFTHLPDDPAWQLRYHSIPQEEFEGYAYVRERFWELNISIEPTIKKCLVKTKDGQVEFKVVIPEEGSQDVYFHYLLHKHGAPVGSFHNVDFHRYVFYRKFHDTATYAMRFPIFGRFKFDIFGEDKNVNENFDLCVSYLVECLEPMPNCEPFPDCPDTGWGPGDEMMKKGMTAVSHLEPVIVSKDGKVKIEMELENPLAVQDALKNNKLGEIMLKNNAMMRIHDNKLTVELRLPEKGEYGLNLYADNLSQEGSLLNVCNYLINNMNDTNLKAFPKLYENLLGRGFMADCFGLEAVNHKEDIIETADGKLNIDFTADADVELFFEVHNNELDGASLAKRVAHTANDENHKFELNLPQAGEYAINVFARTKGDDEQVYHCYTYLVQSEQTEKTALPPMKDKEDVIEMDAMGNLAVIKLPAGKKVRTTNLRRKNAHDVMLQDFVIKETVDGENIFYVTMPEKGEYVFEVFDENENGTVMGTHQYHITRHEIDEEKDEDENLSEEERHQRDIQMAKEARTKHYREKLHSAIKAKDVDQLRHAIEEFEKLGLVEGCDELKKAKRMLQDLEKLLAAGMMIEDIPEHPDIGWGPGDEAALAGLTALTHQEPLIKVEDGEVEIKFAVDHPLAFMQNFKSTKMDDELMKRNAVVRIHDNLVVVSIRLPDKGDYSFNLFGEEEDKLEEMPNLVNYLLHCDTDSDVKPFPKIHESGLGKSILSDHLGVKPVSHTGDAINTDTGKIDIDFAVPEAMEIFVELHNNAIEPQSLAKCATVKNNNSTANVMLELPEQGEYALNVYVRDKSDQNQVHHVHTYLIESSQPDRKALPRGTADLEDNSVPVYVSGDTAVIPIPATSKGRTTELVRKNAQDGIKSDMVHVSKVGDQDVYIIDVPDIGEYKFEVFDQNANGTLGQVREYRIIHDAPSVEKIPAAQANVLTDEEVQRIVAERSALSPLPDIPAIGWGPGNATTTAGLKAITHEEPVIETENGEVEIRFAMKTPDVALIQNLKTNDLEELVLKQNAMMRVDDEELVITVRVPDEGDYALKLFGDERNAQGELPNVCNYLIKSLKKTRINPFPKFHEGGLGKGFFADQFNVKAKTHPGGKIQTELGVVGIEFETDPDVEMVYEICNNDIDNHLSDCVKIKSTDTGRMIDLILPQDGEYAVNVYARKKGDTQQVYHVHTYFLESFQTDRQNLPPAQPPPQIQTLRVNKDHAVIKIPSGKRARTSELLKKNALGQMPDQIKVEYEQKVDIYEVTLPEIGEYRFDVFEEHGNGTLDHIRQFQIFRDEAPPVEKISAEEQQRIEIQKAKDEKRRQILAKLQHAILNEDELMLKVLIKDYEQVVENPADDADLMKARKLLEQLELANQLDDAMARRNLQDLQRLVTKADGYEHLAKKLGMKLQAAKHLLEALVRLEKLRHDILKMDSKAFAEIRSYVNPPPAVHTMLSATFILLGEPEKHLKDWKAVVGLMSRMGKQSIKRRIAEFRTDKLDIEVALFAKKIQSKFTVDDVRKISAGAGTFFVWNQGMVEEAENLYAHNGGDLEAMKQRCAHRIHIKQPPPSAGSKDRMDKNVASGGPVVPPKKPFTKPGGRPGNGKRPGQKR